MTARSATRAMLDWLTLIAMPVIVAIPSVFEWIRGGALEQRVFIAWVATMCLVILGILILRASTIASRLLNKAYVRSVLALMNEEMLLIGALLTRIGFLPWLDSGAKANKAQRDEWLRFWDSVTAATRRLRRLLEPLPDQEARRIEQGLARLQDDLGTLAQLVYGDLQAVQLAGREATPRAVMERMTNTLAQCRQSLHRLAKSRGAGAWLATRVSE